MPNPKLETYKNKATNTVYDLTDANAQASLTAILDGTDIDSFGDVETALADKMPNYPLTDNIEEYIDTFHGVVTIRTKTTDTISAGSVAIPTSRGVDGAFTSIVVSEFTVLDNYAVGDYVKHEAKVYKCTTAHSAGAWVEGDFTQIKVLNEVKNKADRDAAFPRDEQRVLGARQLFRMPYYDGTSKVSHNATFTVNADGSITIDTAGQATDADATFRLMRYDRDQTWLNMLNGLTLRMSSNTLAGARIQGYWASATHSTNGYEWTVDTTQMTNWNFAIFVPSGTTLSNVTIYPLLCLASDTSDKYSAPAMTNRELTEKVNKNTVPTTIESLLANVPNVGDSVTCLLGSATHIMQTLTGGTYDKSGKITLICTASGKYEWWGIIGAGEYFAYGKIDTTTTPVNYSFKVLTDAS
jgi:hypothetical protein